MLRAGPSIAANSHPVADFGPLRDERRELRPGVDLQHDRPGKVQPVHHHVGARSYHGAPPQFGRHRQVRGDVAVPGQVFGQRQPDQSQIRVLAHQSSTGFE